MEIAIFGTCIAIFLAVILVIPYKIKESEKRLKEYIKKKGRKVEDEENKKTRLE